MDATPPRGTASPASPLPHRASLAELQLPCMRILLRMCRHLAALLAPLGPDATADAVPHSGARSLLLLLRPELLTHYLQPAADPGAAQLALRITAQLLQLSRSHPAAVSFETSFRAIGGFDRCARVRRPS